jgi:tetratricopeptide (TPR) repeat protein
MRGVALRARRTRWELTALWRLEKYRRKNRRADVDRAIRLFRRARDAAPRGTFRRALSSRGLGEALDLLSYRTGDPGALAEAVRAVRDAVADVPAEDSSRPMFVLALIDLLSSRFEGDRRALEEAVELARQMMDEAPATRTLELLGGALHSLFSLTGDAGILAEALRTARSAVAAASHGRGDAVGVSMAAGQLHALFEATGDVDALLDAVDAGRRAAAMARKRPDRMICLNNLGTALVDLAQVTDDPDLLDEALRTARATLAITPADGPVRPLVLANLGIGLRCMAETTGDSGILAAAAEAGRESVAATPAGHPMLYLRLVMLQVTLVELLQAAGDPRILREAAQVARQALAVLPAGHPDQAHVLLNHAGALRDMAVWSGDRTLLNDAVRSARRAVAAAPPGHFIRGGALVSLGQALMILGRIDADLTVCMEAARVLRDAVASTPPGHHELADMLSPLGLTLLGSWELTGDREMLAEAVATGRAAVAAAASAEGHKRAKWLSNLGISLVELYKTAPGEAIGDEMVRVLRAAVSASPPGDPTRATYLSNLCMVLRDVSAAPGNTAAASEAVQAGREALAAAPPGHPDRPRYLGNLGRALMNLAGQAQDEELARDGVRVSREAVAAARAKGADAGDALGMLGINLHDLFEQTGDPTALAEAKHVLAEAARSTALTPRGRMGLLRLLAHAEMTTGDSRNALAACERAVALLPQIAARRLTRADREHALGSIFEFPAEVAAAATAAGDPERAVELLEQTRGLLIGETIEADGGLAGLRSLAPELAARFASLRGRLDAADGAAPRAGYRATAEERDRLAQEWDELLAEIREVPGLGDFMRPRGIARLAEQADDGPVVLLYASRHRSDALILRAGPGHHVDVVPLAGAARDDLIAHNERLAAATEAAADFSVADRHRSDQEVRDVLGWLWDHVTGPVLGALGISEPPAAGAPWPRVWWCPVGELAFMPLHAAGCHPGENGGTGTLDRVVSSYTPTIRALEQARQRGGRRGGGSPAALIVAMPTTPGAQPLPGAAAEAKHVAALIGDCLVLAGPAATSDTVLAAITRYQIVHFACHGVSDSLDPGSSMLLFHDHASRPLTVAAVSRLRPRNAALAFLSACSTTRASQRLADEAVHITAAFQLAGYSRVIGTLWPVRDPAATRMCKEVYGRLTAGGTSPARLDESAAAVHAATRRLRDLFPGSPSTWATFIHAGA